MNLTSEELKYFEALSHVCEPSVFFDMNVSSGLNTSEIVSVLKTIKVSFRRAIYSSTFVADNKTPIEFGFVGLSNHFTGMFVYC